jgi:cyanate lyase
MNSSKGRPVCMGEILTVDGRDFLTSYADVTSEQVCLAAMAYQAVNYHWAQNSNMLYDCLCKSISLDVHSIVTTNKASYHLSVPGVNPNDPLTLHYEGVCFLKAIIDEMYINMLNNTTVACINLATLGTFMKMLTNSILQVQHLR